MLDWEEEERDQNLSNYVVEKGLIYLAWAEGIIEVICGGSHVLNIPWIFFAELYKSMEPMITTLKQLATFKSHLIVL